MDDKGNDKLDDRMTAKRFKLIYKPNTIIWDNFEDEEVFAWADDDNPKEIVNKLNELAEEIEQLQQELFESEEECLMIDYSDNPVRRDAYIELLKEHFKERFGRDFE